MIDIVTLFPCLCPHLNATTVRQLSRIIFALLAMTGRVTMLGLSRWAGPGGSYRTIQRFFSTVIPWGMVFWVFFRHHLFDPQDRYICAGDECVVTKSGKKTYGLDRFFPSLYGKPVPGLGCLKVTSRAQFSCPRFGPREPHSAPQYLGQLLGFSA